MEDKSLVVVLQGAYVVPVSGALSQFSSSIKPSQGFT